MDSTSNVFPHEVIRGRKDIADTVGSDITAEQIKLTVAVDRYRSTCCNCGANVLMESEPCPKCNIIFRYVVYGNVGDSNTHEQIDQIVSEAFGLKQLGTFRGAPGQSTFELILNSK